MELTNKQKQLKDDVKELINDLGDLPLSELRLIFKDAEFVQKYLTIVNTMAETKGIWLCACGTRNSNNNVKCKICGSGKLIFKGKEKED